MEGARLLTLAPALAACGYSASIGVLAGMLDMVLVSLLGPDELAMFAQLTPVAGGTKRVALCFV